MKNKKMWTIIGVVAVIAIVVGCVVWYKTAENNFKEAEKDLQETIDKYGFVEEEYVDILVGKFNAEVVDNSSLNPASSDYMKNVDGTYSYGLISGIWLFVDPIEYKNDASKEIVDYMTIYVKKSSEYTNDGLEYVKHLIKANNSEITDAEIDNLMKDAKDKALAGGDDIAYNGSGIMVGYVEDDESFQYQVHRFYE